MFPATQSLLERIMREEEELPALERDAVRLAPDDPALLQLKLRRRNQQALLKRMMADAGYENLARATTISRGRVEDYDER